jgi:hypothetical protein
MTKLHLRYVQSFRSAGATYHYFRRRGMPRVPLPGIVGSAEFMAAYQQALAAAPQPVGADKRSKPGSISAALAEYYDSQAFKSLTGGTPAQRRSILERFRETHGHLPLASLPKEFLVLVRLDGTESGAALATRAASLPALGRTTAVDPPGPDLGHSYPAAQVVRSSHLVGI